MPTKNNFEDRLKVLLRRYIDDPTDVGFNGAVSINGAPLRTKNEKTIENFLRWLERE